MRKSESFLPISAKLWKGESLDFEFPKNPNLLLESEEPMVNGKIATYNYFYYYFTYL